MKSAKKYVVLEHLLMPDKGIRFWTTNSENNTHSFNGELWYKEVLFTDSVEEAKIDCFLNSKYPTIGEIFEHFLKNSELI